MNRWSMVVAALVLWALRPGPGGRGDPDSTRRARVRLSTGRSAGRVVAAASAVVALAVAPPLGIAFVAAVAVHRARKGLRRERSRLVEVERSLPEAIDLLALVVSAGVPPLRALAMVAPRCPAPHRQAWAEVVARVEAGETYADAVGHLIIRLGPPMRPLVTALLAAERDGVALVPAQDRCGAEAHRRRRVRAEEAARRVPVLMLFPLVFCVLPAFGLLTVVPLLAGSISDLQLPA